MVDEGDESDQYEFLMTLNHNKLKAYENKFEMMAEPEYLKVHRQNGVSVGGLPEFHGPSTTTVHADLKNSKFRDLSFDLW